MTLYNYLAGYERPLESLEERFWAKVCPTGFCWLWEAYKDANGYGLINIQGSKAGLAHRIAYLLLVGEFDRNIHLDHLCRNPSCVNPDHLEPVTREENIRRGYGSVGLSDRSICSKGHPIVEGNRVKRLDTGAYRCADCQYDIIRRRTINKKARELNVTFEEAEKLVRRKGRRGLGG